MRPIRVPIFLSLCLHGLAMALLGLMPFGAKVVFDDHHEISVELVELPVPQAVEPPIIPLPEPPLPVVQKASAQQARPPAMSRSHRQVLVRPMRSRTTSQARHAIFRRVDPEQRSLEAPLSASVPIPAFIEIPRNFSPTASTRSKSFEGERAELQSEKSLVPLPDGGNLPSLQRPLLHVQATSSQPRLLKDLTPETTETPRSKVKLGSNMRPEYPRTAREAGWDGTVMLRVEVLPDGKAGAVAVHKSSGHHILDEAAVAAVQRWRFTPAMDGNFPISSVVHLPVKFDLRAPF
jgi:TonB family protein